MAASMKLGSKSEGFLRRGQAWFCTTGLPSDVVVQVDEMTFHLHKFPLMSKSGLLEKLITESLESRDQLRNEDDEDEDDEEQRGCVVQLAGIPGGTESFELAAKFCYGVKLELTASNIVPLRCAAEYLEMTEQLGEGNLIVKAEGFLNQVVLRSWKDSVRALQSCEKVLEQAEKLQIVKRCVDSISSKACTDPSLFGWPLMDHHLTMQSPGGSVLWNGISTGARPRNSRSDWWYEDVASLSLSMFERLVAAMEVRGLKPEIVAGAVMSYGKRYLPGLNRRRGEGGGGGGGGGGSSSARSGLYSAPVTTLSEVDQRILLETIQRLLPAQKGVVPVRFLFGLLKLSMLLGASSDCKASLEARIGMQLEQAGLDDLLMPNYSYTVETLYDIDVVQRIVEHFLSSDGGGSSVNTLGNLVSLSYDHDGSPNNGAVTPMMQVAKLMDAYLAEVAPDVNLKMGKFQALAESLPEYARLVDDGLYRAIDIYLKAHHWLTELEREKLCRTMDCQKLSLEACTHAAQNERLPLRVVVQVLFFEQLQLRTAIAGCFLVSENVEASRPAYQNPRDAASGAAAAAAAASNRAAAGGGGGGEGWANVLRENQVMKVDMDRMRSRVIELEKECTQMRQEIEKIGNGKSGGGGGGGGGGGVKSSHAVLAASMMSSFSLAKKLGCRSKPHALKPQDVMKPPQPAPPPEDDLDEGSLKAAAAAARAAGVAAPQVRRRHRRTHSLV